MNEFHFSGKANGLSENYSRFEGALADDEKSGLSKIREAILEIYRTHGLGYHDKIYYEFIKAEFDHREIDWNSEQEVEITLDGTYLKHFHIPFILIQEKYLLGLKAIHEKIDSYDIAQTLTYLRKLNLHIGLFLNFGKEELQIQGIFKQ